MTFQRAYKIASHNSTVNGGPGRDFDWSLFDWQQETEHNFGDMRYAKESPFLPNTFKGQLMGVQKAPAVYVDGGLIAPNCQYLHVPYNWAEHTTIYRVRPNPTMEAGQVYRGYLVIKQEAEEREDGWYWVLTMEKPGRAALEKACWGLAGEQGDMDAAQPKIMEQLLADATQELAKEESDE